MQIKIYQIQLYIKKKQNKNNSDRPTPTKDYNNNIINYNNCYDNFKNFNFFFFNLYTNLCYRLLSSRGPKRFVMITNV